MSLVAAERLWGTLGDILLLEGLCLLFGGVLRLEVIVGYMLKISNHMILTCVQVAGGDRLAVFAD